MKNDLIEDLSLGNYFNMFIAIGLGPFKIKCYLKYLKQKENQSQDFEIQNLKIKLNLLEDAVNELKDSIKTMIREEIERLNLGELNYRYFSWCKSKEG